MSRRHPRKRKIGDFEVSEDFYKKHMVGGEHLRYAADLSRKGERAYFLECVKCYGPPPPSYITDDFRDAGITVADMVRAIYSGYIIAGPYHDRRYEIPGGQEASEATRDFKIKFCLAREEREKQKAARIAEEAFAFLQERAEYGDAESAWGAYRIAHEQSINTRIEKERLKWERRAKRMKKAEREAYNSRHRTRVFSGRTNAKKELSALGIII